MGSSKVRVGVRVRLVLGLRLGPGLGSGMAAHPHPSPRRDLLMVLVDHARSCKAQGGEWLGGLILACGPSPPSHSPHCFGRCVCFDG